MYIVSGCPRSGTSLMMDLMRAAFGEKRLRAKQFTNKVNKIQRGTDEPDRIFEFREYIWSLKNKAREDIKDMNPEGFWEHPFTVRGVWFDYNHRVSLGEIEKEEAPSIMKIVSQGLAKSDPRYIDKIVYMLRDPGSVAKSQERLRRNLKYKNPETGSTEDLSESIVVNDPTMFMQVSIGAASWMLDNPQVEVHLVNYNDLLNDTEKTLKGVQDFLGEGDFTKAAGVVRQDLSRSTDHPLDHERAEAAFTIYEFMKKMDWQGLLGYHQSQNEKQFEIATAWQCLRTGMQAFKGMCDQCHGDKLLHKSFKEIAQKKSMDWRKAPCVYECVFEKERSEYVKIADSIQNNHWKD